MSLFPGGIAQGTADLRYVLLGPGTPGQTLNGGALTFASTKQWQVKDASGNVLLQMGDQVAAKWYGARPHLTVSPTGIATGGTVFNAGADYGPDTPATTTSGIQEAINALPVGGGVIKLLAGSFNVTAGITISADGTVLEGVAPVPADTGNGYLTTIIKNGLALNAGSLITVSAVRWSIRWLWFNGNGNAQTGTATNSLVNATAGLQGLVDGCAFHCAGNFPIGLRFLPALSHVKDCVVTNATVAGIQVLGAGNDFWIEGCYMTGAAMTAIQVKPSQPGFGRITGCDITGVTTCLELDVSTANLNYLKVSDCQFDNPSSYGLYVHGGNALFGLHVVNSSFTFGTNNVYMTGAPILVGVKFTGCSFESATQDGIYLNNLDCRGPLSFDNCNILHSGTSSGAGAYANIRIPAGLALTGGGLNLQFTGCVFGDTTVYNGTIYPKYGIALGTAAILTLYVNGGLSTSYFAGGGFIDNPGNLRTSGGYSFSRITDLANYNPMGFATTTPGVAASGTAVQNTNPYPVQVLVQGNAVGTCTVKITDPSGTNGGVTPILLAGSGGEFTVQPGGKITLTYANAPTWVWEGA